MIESLYKGKEPCTDCANYRPVSLLVPGKVFAHILLGRMQLFLNRHCHPQQSGFAAGQSTMLVLPSGFWLSCIKNLTVCFMWRFDSVNRTLACTGRSWCSNIPLTLMRNLHTCIGVRVGAGSWPSLCFCITSGVQQGCILVPVLFCQAINWILILTAPYVTIKFGQEEFSVISEVLVSVLLMQKSENFSPTLQSFQDTACTLASNISWQKTKDQNLGVGHQIPPVQVGLHTVERVDEFI